MHSAFTAVTFLLIVLAPCFVALRVSGVDPGKD
jgi:hypothetical protein